MLLAKTASTEILIFTNFLVARYSQTSSGTQIAHSKPPLNTTESLNLSFACIKRNLHFS